MGSSKNATSISGKISSQRGDSMGAMTAVFVHGVPETPAVWRGLLTALDRPDIVVLSLPGFGSARPAGFGATMEEYAAWLAAQLERLGDPVDLVGHDWGGGFVVRVVSTRPELVRSWVTDAAGIGDVEFEWHDFAKIWQTPQAGEDFWDQQLAAPAEERAGVFQMFGVPREPALDLASHIDRTMADCILDLYRSAVDVGERWGPDFAAIPAPRTGDHPRRRSLPERRLGDQGRRTGRRQDGRPRRARPLVDAPGPCPGGDRAARILGHPGLTAARSEAARPCQQAVTSRWAA
jgi:pimeloyl-ACP methyl ester carboxylesterase